MKKEKLKVKNLKLKDFRLNHSSRATRTPFLDNHGITRSEIINHCTPALIRLKETCEMPRKEAICFKGTFLNISGSRSSSKL